jgi:hypothetical protein
MSESRDCGRCDPVRVGAPAAREPGHAGVVGARELWAGPGHRIGLM